MYVEYNRWLRATHTHVYCCSNTRKQSRCCEFCPRTYITLFIASWHREEAHRVLRRPGLHPENNAIYHRRVANVHKWFALHLFILCVFSALFFYLNKDSPHLRSMGICVHGHHAPASIVRATSRGINELRSLIAFFTIVRVRCDCAPIQCAISIDWGLYGLRICSAQIICVYTNNTIFHPKLQFLFCVQRRD